MRGLQTWSGQWVDVEAPRPGDILLVDIAVQLSRICRFHGCTRDHYSVAEHCIRASRIAEPRFRLAALLHDASEAYVNDLATPVKYAKGMSAYRRIEQRFHDAIGERFGVDFEAARDELKRVDQIMFATEARDLMRNRLWYGDLVDPLPETIEPMDMETAMRTFVFRFDILRRQGVVA